MHHVMHLTGHDSLTIITCVYLKQRSRY
uniref:Putative disease resistance protein RGA3 n=1 Tax=Rhizophora mucronata TaxID=61149 RepID=A0A2P2M5T4_RHIMU